ncbi:MAG: hypothetical protein ABSA93_10365 [Streptosporangiaceae bacterium]
MTSLAASQELTNLSGGVYEIERGPFIDLPQAVDVTSTGLYTGRCHIDRG